MLPHRPPRPLYLPRLDALPPLLHLLIQFRLLRLARPLPLLLSAQRLLPSRLHLICGHRRRRGCRRAVLAPAQAGGGGRLAQVGCCIAVYCFSARRPLRARLRAAIASHPKSVPAAHQHAAATQLCWRCARPACCACGPPGPPAPQQTASACRAAPCSGCVTAPCRGLGRGHACAPPVWRKSRTAVSGGPRQVPASKCYQSAPFVARR